MSKHQPARFSLKKELQDLSKKSKSARVKEHCKKLLHYEERELREEAAELGGKLRGKLK